jgi:hypothetical protein
VDPCVAQADRTQAIDVRLGRRVGLVGELDREVAERARPLVELCGAVIVLRMLCQVFRGALGTEVVRVRLDSVVAVVRA